MRRAIGVLALLALCACEKELTPTEKAAKDRGECMVLATDQSAKLPENDGWGHALEYCLHTSETAGSGHLVGVRSPGRDGRFDGTSYAPAGFDPAHSDHDDIVWIDGVFVTWPESR